MTQLHGKFTKEFSLTERIQMEGWNGNSQSPQYYDTEDVFDVIASHSNKPVYEPVLAPSVKDFYSHVVEKQKAIIKERQDSLVFTHGDAKWANWFRQDVLGDFGSSCFSTEYRDIAKAVLDLEHAGNTDVLDSYLSVYHTFRTLDAESTHDNYETFRINVFENVFTECMRNLMAYPDNEKMISHHIDLALQMKQELEYVQ